MGEPLAGPCLKKTKLEPSSIESNNRPHRPPGKVTNYLKEKQLSDFAKTVDLRFNVESGQYTQFIDDLRARLADHPYPRRVKDRSVLAKENPKYPARWMFIHLTAGEYVASLAIRDDNLYLKAFKSKEQWYEIGLKKQNPEPLLPEEFESKVLQCGDNYGSLAGGGKNKKLVKRSLMELKLGKDSMIQAVSELASYVGGDDDIPKQALAQLIVMICEAARMTPHHKKVKQAWVPMGETQISELEVDYLWNWGRMSGALLAWDKDNCMDWPDKEFFVGEPNIFDADKALSVVQLVKDSRPPKRIRNKELPEPADGGEEGNRSPSNSTRPAGNNKKHGRDQTPSQPPPSQGAGGGDHHEGAGASSRQRQAAEYTACHGRRLVEVFALAVSADSEFPVGTTIAVYDGKRGQIIYKHEDRKKDDNKTLDNLVLTGPYTAISAEGSFAIEIETSKGGKPETFYGEWDCSDDKNEEDELLCQKLGPVYITYAVLSNALEANVEFKLPLSADSNIHNSLSGKIIAYNQMFKVESILFNRKKAKLPSDSIIPLARSVFAVPIGCQIKVEMNLSATTPDRSSTMAFNGAVEFYCGDSAKVLPTANGDVEMNITWYPEFTDCEEKRQSSPSGTNPRELVYNMMDGNYATFMTEFRNLLAEHPHSEEVQGHHVLARQRATQPARWIHPKLVAGEEETTLAIRDDNVYLTGFMNKWGDWYELSGPTERSARMLPEEYNSSLLEWSYYGKMGDMMVTRLDQSFATIAVHMLSCYDPDKVTSTSVVDGIDLAMALAGLTVMVCESARMSSHYDTISQRLNKECTLSMWQVKYLRNWKRMSRALLNWKGNGFINWPSDPEVEDTHITSGREALRVVELLLNWSPRMRAAAASPGRCLVELLAVTADVGTVGTTITVFDGKRGQIIYRHQQTDDRASNLDSQGNLVLTGPYRPISAAGCFAIQVDIPAAAHGGDDDDDDDVGDSIFWEWDGYDEVCSAQVDNNPPSNRSISTGPGRTVHITYAVMSNATAGTVLVSLPLAGHARVYGEITAYNGTMRRVLFSSTAGVAVAVEAFSPDRSIVPLARPVIAVPLGQCLNIHVSMHAYPDQDGVLQDFEGTVQFDGHSRRQFPTTHGIVEIGIIWNPEFPSSTGCS